MLEEYYLPNDESENERLGGSPSLSSAHAL